MTTESFPTLTSPFLRFKTTSLLGSAESGCVRVLGFTQSAYCNERFSRKCCGLIGRRQFPPMGNGIPRFPEFRQGFR